MKKLLAAMALPLFLVAGQAQDIKQDNYTAIPAEIAAQGYTYTHAVPSDTSTIHYFAFLFDAAPATVTLNVTPCTGTPADSPKVCSGVITSALAQTLSILTVYGKADYYLVSVTWTGQISRASVGITGYVR